MGTQQMMSVPYALYAANSGSNAGWADSAGNIHNTNTTQRVGIGTTTPATRLHVADSSVVFTGGEFPSSEMAGNPPVSGPGNRMMWYADKAAFRVGGAYSNEWDKENVGTYSFASGSNTTASGNNSTAMGSETTASGDVSTAMGGFTVASGSHSTAIGTGTIASGFVSTAMGGFNTASGENSTAIGNYCNASGDYSTAIGTGSYTIGMLSTAIGTNAVSEGHGSNAMGSSLTRATGDYSFSIGTYTHATGDLSTAMGTYSSTNNKKGSFIIGDASHLTLSYGDYPTVELFGLAGTNNDADNQMMMRFAGGYKLYNDTLASKGLEITPSGSAKYMSNVTATFTDRSLVDKHYVDSVAAGGSSSGWADTAGNIHNTNTTQRVGIGTTTPAARLHVADSSVVFTGESDPWSTYFSDTYGNPPVSGPGSRMMWYADKAAFRVGGALENEWDKENVGVFSFASGWGNKASGEMSTAMGVTTTASGVTSTALGNWTIASGDYSFALGAAGTTASGDYSTAISVNSTASGDYSTVMGGRDNTASGDYSTVIGVQSGAEGDFSIAMGYQTGASGDYSTAMGNHVSTNGKTGSFAVGDNTEFYTYNDAPNQMMMKFSGGYKLYTDTFATVGVSLPAGGNSWATISDRNKKENFAAVDGEAFLRKIAKFNLTSWNYKGQDPATHRHYGPMAQDFYAAFGKDQYGTIGNDTTISQADMEGVSFVAIQALVKENEAMKAKINHLEQKNSTLNTELNVLKAELTNNLQETNNRMQEIEKLLRKENTAAK